MPNLLAIDTTDFSISLALMRSGAIVAERRISDSGIAEHLMSNIQSLLREGEIGFDDLNKIAVIVGPGSYTGIRSGLATVIGICSGTAGNIQVVPISKLQAQAFFISKESQNPKIVFSLLTANTSEYFAGAYYCRSNHVDEIVAPTSVLKSELGTFTQNALVGFEKSIGSDSGNLADLSVEIIDADVNFASIAATMADAITETTSINDLKPLYIKPVNAKTLAERQKGLDI